MSKSNASLKSSELALDERIVGPAEVIGVGVRDVDVRLESGTVVAAVVALATRYEARVGDEVLVISQGGRSWIIGVISGSGSTALSFDGDVELRSNHGVVRVSGARGVEVDAPRIDLRSTNLSIVAEAMVTRVASFTQRVRDLMSIHVGKKHEIVDGSSTTQAKSSTLLTQEDVKINGRTVHLG